MPSIDMPLEELERYRPAPYREPDFDDFWRTTLGELAAVDPELELLPVAVPFPGFAAWRLAFRSLGGGRVTGWLMRRESDEPQPGLCFCHGYSARGARVLELLPYAAAGFVAMSFDCRGQMGDADDVAAGKGHAIGWLTSGIADPETYYYRFVYADAVRCLELLSEQEGVDPGRVAVAGVSQGGGLTLAAAALSDRAGYAWSDIPFLCDFFRCAAIVEKRPYSELSDLLRARPDLVAPARRTLSYFDALNLAASVACPTVVTAALWDDVCPPSSVFGTFAQLGTAEKRLEVLSYSRHELSYELNEARLAGLIGFAAL